LHVNKLRALTAVTVVALAVALSSCAAPRGGRLEELRSKPERQAAAYVPDIAATLAKGLPERVAPIPPLALDYLRRIDHRPDYAAYAPSAEERGVLGRCLGLIPPAFKAAMEERLLGIYFVDGFEGGGMTDFCFGPDGDSTYLLLFINPETLKKSLSDWIAYRDSSPYAPDASGIELRSSCPGGEGYPGLLHTLVHESAHAYDYVHHATPYIMPVFSGAPKALAPDGLDFTRGVWTEYAKPIPAYAIPRRAQSAAYGLGPTLPLSVALDQYRALVATPFASFYGSGSWAEDFAEAAAWTYLREKLSIGYEVVIMRGGTEALRFSPSESRWSEGRKAAVSKAFRL
jgi:hypothetical protein